MVNLNRLGLALAAGALAGLVIGGIGARLAMRAVALLGSGQPSFTVAGTLGILVVGAVLGAAGGLGFAVVLGLFGGPRGEKTAPLRGVVIGVVYGAALAALAVLPFFLAPSGELALAPPLVGAALFGWIPLAYGLTLGIVVPLVERRVSAGQRRVGLGWLAAFGLSLMLALAAMGSLLGEFVPFPPAATRLYGDLGLSFQAAHSLHRWLVLATMLAYCGLAGLVFWRGSHDGTARLAAVTLLLLAAGFFGREPALAGGMTALPLVGLLPGLLQAVGLSLLLVLLYVLPDGRFGLRWTRLAAVAWCGWTLLWFTNPLPGMALDVSAWPEGLVAALLALGLGSGLVALARRTRQSTLEQGRQLRPMLVGFTLALLSWALLWLLSLPAPELRLRSVPMPSALLAFGPYLLPWLLLPGSLVVAMRRGLWAVGQGLGSEDFLKTNPLQS